MHIGGSARSYPRAFVPLESRPPTADRAGGSAVCLCIPALGANARICRWEEIADSRGRNAGAGLCDLIGSLPDTCPGLQASGEAVAVGKLAARSVNPVADAALRLRPGRDSLHLHVGPMSACSARSSDASSSSL
jgi:hypothetical protein